MDTKLDQEALTAEMAELKDLCDKLLELEADPEAKMGLTSAFATIIDAAHKLNDALRPPIVGVKVAITGTPEEKLQKLEFFNDLMCRTINLGMKSLSVMLLSQHEQWDQVVPVMRRIQERIKVHIEAGMVPLDAITAAVDEAKEIPEESRANILAKLKEHAAEFNKHPPCTRTSWQGY